MLLALGVTALIALALVWQLSVPALARRWRRVRAAIEQERPGALVAGPGSIDAGRERRAERRARALLRSCVNAEEWAMYRDLGFLVVVGAARFDGGPAARRAHAHAPCVYLIYPHQPIVAFAPRSGAILGEYCLALSSGAGLACGDEPPGSGPLPDADDVLAKWLLLCGDEAGVLAQANLHLPGRQVHETRVRSDLARLGAWERARAREGVAAGRTCGESRRRAPEAPARRPPPVAAAGRLRSPHAGSVPAQ